MDFTTTPPSMKFHELREKLFMYMKDENYSFYTMNTYRKISDLLEQYLIGKGISDYTQSLGLEFLHTCKNEIF